jgi:hypothetical protein
MNVYFLYSLLFLLVVIDDDGPLFALPRYRLSSSTPYLIYTTTLSTQRCVIFEERLFWPHFKILVIHIQKEYTSCFDIYNTCNTTLSIIE